MPNTHRPSDLADHLSPPTGTPSSADPLDPIDAVTHPDPWSWYERLAEAPVHLDRRLGCWVVARPGDVASVLTAAEVTVRPVDAPVPVHLAGTPVGELVSGMVRLRDGDRHRAARAAIESMLTSVTPTQLDEAIDRATALLDRSTIGADEPGLIAAWADRFAAATIAALLGSPDEALDDLATAAIALARTCAPAAPPATVPAALEALAVIDRWWLELAAGPLVEAMTHCLGPSRHDLVRANVAGCLVQSVDACAGAVTSLLERRLAEARDWDALTHAVFAETPPVHNTRRWTDVELRLPGGTVPAGGAMLIVLVAGSDPDRGFGAGAHRCPARDLVPRIVRAAVSGVWDRLHDPDALMIGGSRPSANVRIADLAGATT